MRRMSSKDNSDSDESDIEENSPSIINKENLLTPNKFTLMFPSTQQSLAKQFRTDRRKIIKGIARTFLYMVFLAYLFESILFQTVTEYIQEEDAYLLNLSTQMKMLLVAVILLMMLSKWELHQSPVLAIMLYLFALIISLIVITETDIIAVQFVGIIELTILFMCWIFFAGLSFPTLIFLAVL